MPARRRLRGVTVLKLRVTAWKPPEETCSLQGKARQGKAGKARQGKANLIRKMLCRPELPRRRLQAAATAAGCVRHDEPPPARAASVALARRVRRPCWHAHWPAWPQDFQCAGCAWRTCRGWAASLAAPAARGGLCVLPGEEIEQRACGGAPAERVGRAGRAQEPAPPQEPSPRTWAARRCRQLVECTAACLRAACMRAPRAALSARRLVDTRAPRSRWLPATASARTALSCPMRRRYARRITHHRVQPRLLGPLRTLRAFPDVCARRISSAPQGAAHPLFPAPSALPGACRRPDSTRAR